MKRINILITFVFSTLLFAQTNPVISKDLNNVTPPSPTVSSLMKYQEIPVNNYTGVPDISIPLIQSLTNSKDIPIDISIKYHPGNVKADNIAGEVGLGWTVFAGGTISRTVRGLPDEEIVTASTTQSGKVGIYQNSIQNHKNIYYDFEQDPSSFELNNPEISNEYYWETVENGKYDTEHDLWQFNFMGNSGSFIIKKDGNVLKVEPVSDYRIKIENHYDTINNQPYTPTGFTVYDEKGYKYVFDIFETTTKAVDTESTTKIQSDYVTSTGHSNERPFRSAFHLTQVINTNNQEVFHIEYDNRPLIESNVQSNLTVNDYGNNLDILRYANCWSEMEPLQIRTVSISAISVKKIKAIYIPQRAKIEFEYAEGRSDTNTNNNSTFLKEIKLSDPFDRMIYKYTFNYDYHAILHNRMFLRSIVKNYPSNSITEKHDFFYKRTLPLQASIIGKDYWGYFNTFAFQNCNSQDITFMREPSALVSTLDLLQKIKYPTGGSSVLKFESNQYSFIGDEPVTDFSNNPNYTYLGMDSFAFPNNDNTYKLIPIHNKDRKVLIYTNIVLQSDPTTWTRNIFLSKITNGNPIPVGSIYCVEPNGDCCFEFTLEKNVQYAFKRNNFNINYHGTDQASIKYYEINPQKFLYGGGNRISRIAYFDNDIAQDYYDNTNNMLPQKEFLYSYNMPDDIEASSGSLVFGKPVFEENRFFKQMGTTCAKSPYSYCLAYDGLSSYISRRTTSNQEMTVTNGADIGYKYVKVQQTGLGSTEYTYTSPMDYPEELLITFTKPYLPSKNIDYKRGLLLEEKYKDNAGKLLTRISNTYEFINYEKLYGYRFNKPDGISFQGRLEGHSYNAFKTAKESSQSLVSSPPGSGCAGSFSVNSFSKANLGNPIEDIDFYPLIQAYGWAKLSTKNTKNYFYENGTQKVLEKNESFEYNPLNKNISQNVLNTEDGTELKTKYYYHTGNTQFSQNRISEIEQIESYKNGKLLNINKIVYANNWYQNSSYLPYKIQSAMLNNILSTDVTYDRYDEKGNILQYTTKDGIPVAIVWGYNKTQPIAKVEGITYDQLTSSVPVSGIVTASDNDAADPAQESLLLDALNSFRKQSALSGKLISTYTYDPLIGVTSITPPSGVRQTYTYDSANRLKETGVRSKNSAGSYINKKVSENKYNYKP